MAQIYIKTFNYLSIKELFWLPITHKRNKNGIFAIMFRYFTYLSYDGSNYHGWQVQPNGTTVEETLEKALSLLLHTPIDVTGAGRTDAGVHARVMVAHFDVAEQLHFPLDAHQLAYRLNKMLPRDISISRILPVSTDLHARFSATRRTYHYYIHTEKDPFQRAYSHEIHYTLDFDKMNRAAQKLIGMHDFKCFCKAGSDVKTTLCDLYEAHWDTKDGHSWCFTISANRFLRNMVRAVVGTLVEVGRGRMTLKQFEQVLNGGSRSDAGESMPGHALFLWDVAYDADNAHKNG